MVCSLSVRMKRSSHCNGSGGQWWHAMAGMSFPDSQESAVIAWRSGRGGSVTVTPAGPSRKPLRHLRNPRSSEKRTLVLCGLAVTVIGGNLCIFRGSAAGSDSLPSIGTVLGRRQSAAVYTPLLWARSGHQERRFRYSGTVAAGRLMAWSQHWVEVAWTRLHVPTVDHNEMVLKDVALV
jgi:hypothetical protein